MIKEKWENNWNGWPNSNFVVICRICGQKKTEPGINQGMDASVNNQVVFVGTNIPFQYLVVDLP